MKRLRDARHHPLVFRSGPPATGLDAALPAGCRQVEQEGDTLGERLRNAFDRLLVDAGDRAVIIGSDSPDIPLRHIKRAFTLLRRRDVVLGPAADGGYYLVGLRTPSPDLFEDVPWGGPTVFDRTVRAVERSGLSLSVLPLWYDVDDASSLGLLAALCRARRVSGGLRLPHTERVLDALRAGE